MAKRKKSDDDQSTDNINESDDNFGLPEIEYEPINREQSASSQTEEVPQEEPVQESVAAEEIVVESNRDEVAQEQEHIYNSIEPDEESSSAPKIAAIVLVILLAGAAGWYFLKYRPAKLAEEKAKQEQLEKDRLAAEKLKAAELEELKRKQAEQRIADSLAALPKEGTIETLSDRTKRYYVVVASDIDDDLIMDYAHKLSKQGVSSKIIPPFGKVKFFRIAISDADSYRAAQAKADEVKGQYGDATWVVKY